MNSRFFAAAAVCAVAIGLAGCSIEQEGLLQTHVAEASVAPGQAGCATALPDSRLEELIGILGVGVDGLLAAGTLNQGQARALTNHLETANRHLLKGAYCAMRASLNAFREQLDDLVIDGALTDRQAYELRHTWRLFEAPTEPVPQTRIEAYAPGVVGEPRSIQRPSGEFRYEVIDGLAIFGGDGILGYADEFEATFGSTAGSSTKLVQARSGACSGEFLFFCNRWPNQTVHYDIRSTSWGDPATNTMMRQRVQAAVQMWEENTGLRFERRFGDNMLVFRNATGCSSWVGMELFKISDPQFVNISRDCTMGNIMHEIGHAVGVFHEQSRGDRDDFVRVDFGQVAEGSREQFYQFLDFGNDIGPYDFGSIMHYDCDAFEKDGASGPTVEPIVPGFGCADIGQRDGFSDGDIFGTYRLYPPQYRIVGAEPDAVSDRFELSVEFSTKPVRDEYIVWRVFGIERGPRGATFSSVDTGILPGRYPFVAEIQIGGETLTTEVIWLTVAANEVPVVDLGPDRDAFVGETVAIVSSVADPEDGSCPVPLCTFTWDPAPTLDRGGVADFVFDTPGEHVVSLAVQDGTGATGSGQVRITVTQKPFVPIINTPTRGHTFNPGATTVAMGSATWGDDVLTCSQVGGVWSSSDPGDVLSTRNSCSADITFSATSGPRTITMNATSPAGGVPVLATVDVVVEACVGNCPPDVSFEILPDPILDGSAYQPPFTGPGYYLTTRLQIHGQMRDPDGASGELIQYELSVSPPCLGGCAPIPLASGSGIGPIEAFIPWVPANDIAIWTNCAQTALPYKITLSARDAGGAQRETSRTIHLACTLR